ncbi:hypothetical protein LEP1GSC105_4012, partial [Leptospira interrogans str. UI 12758]
LDKAIELLQKARQKWPFDQDLKKKLNYWEIFLLKKIFHPTLLKIVDPTAHKPSSF